MSTLSTTVRRGLVVTAAAVAAGPVAGGVASAATGSTTTVPFDTAPLTNLANTAGPAQIADALPVARMAPGHPTALAGLPLVGQLGQTLPLANVTQALPFGSLVQNLPVSGLTSGVPLAGPAFSGLTGGGLNGLAGGLSGAPASATAMHATPITRSLKIGQPAGQALSPAPVTNPNHPTGTPVISDMPTSTTPQNSGQSEVSGLSSLLNPAGNGSSLPVLGGLSSGGLSNLGSMTAGMPVLGGVTGLLGRF